jgi:hypothetical protein
MPPTVTSLPYQGPPVQAKPKHARLRSNTVEIPFASLHAHEEQQVAESLGSHDPYEILTRKVTHLATLLGVDEPEAERILFDRIGS